MIDPDRIKTIKEKSNEEKKNMKDEKIKAQDDIGHYDLDGVSYSSEDEDGGVIVVGDETHQPDKKAENKDENDLLKAEFTTEEEEKRKLTEEPEKMDREINLDFEGEMKRG